MATVIIPAWIDKEGEENGKDIWLAQTVTGLFARGEGFVGAREALARLIIEEKQFTNEAAAIECDTEDDTEVTAVRILATTRKTFTV
jgi:hypothetical protein